MPTQGLQTALTPRDQYRKGLAALAEYCRATFVGRTFDQLASADQDHLLGQLEKGEVTLPGFEGQGAVRRRPTPTPWKASFPTRSMAATATWSGWKLVGFPGTRYDYRDVMERPNQPYTQPPVSLAGRPAWDVSK